MQPVRRTRLTVGILCVLVILTAGGIAPVAVPGSSGPARALAAAPACSPSSPTPTSTSGAPLAKAGTLFGFNLFHRLFGAQPKGDTFMSPISVALALDMLYDGARGNTAAAMARTLALHGLTAAQVNRAAATLIHSLSKGDPAPKNVGNVPLQPSKLRIANSLWSRQGLTFNPQFSADLQKYFGAQASSLAFSSPSAAATINRWASCETQGKITQVVGSTANLMMLLVNAVYFEGGWSMPFSPSQTTSQKFTTGTGAVETVRMMHQTSNFGYYHGSNFQALSLPYGFHQRFSMIVVLPNKGVSLAQFAPKLTSTNWGYWAKETSFGHEHYGIVGLPHIDVQYSSDLVSPLKALGMGAAFGAGANFSGICTAACSVQSILHKTFLHVDEKGTTAAAITALGFGGGGGPPPVPFHFICDHPFFLGIRDGRTGSTLFLGAINKP